MHHFKHVYRSWKRNRYYAHAGGYTTCAPRDSSPLTMQTRGHHRGGSNFGVRRPLRYLSHQLDLDEGQARKVASILNRLKTEQEQAALDRKRTLTAVADLMAGVQPLEEELVVALEPRKRSEERMQEEVKRAIQALHQTLDQDQRERLADLMLAGSFSL